MRETVWAVYYEDPIRKVVGCHLFRTEEACKEFEEKTKDRLIVIAYEEIPIYGNYYDYSSDYEEDNDE